MTINRYEQNTCNKIKTFTVTVYFIIFSNAHGLDIDPVYLTVSSLYRIPIYGSTLVDRELQVHWDPELYTKVAIFTTDPTDSEPVFQVTSKEFPEGYLESNISLGTPVFPSGWDKNSDARRTPGEHCLPLWIGAYQGDNLVHIQCIRIHPTWMFDNRLSLGELSLTSLFIPGTHNSACHRRGDSLSQRDTIGRFLLTQDQDIWSQLVYGIRYIDIRVGIYPIRRSNGSEEISHEDVFWINHDLLKVRPLLPVLQDIRLFLESAPKEIVILDLHRFPVGFSGRHHRHHRLVDLLQRELGNFTLPYTGTWPTLDKIWEQNRTLIISYGNDAVVKENSWLWPPVKQMWGNQQNISGLFAFLDECMNNPKLKEPNTGLWAAMAQLTPSPLDLLFNPTGSLREMAHSINRNLTEWCHNLWWNKANIVTSDYFLENNLINIAIAANIHKGNVIKRYYLTDD
ncbi:PI-PLC X domain-containing protein 1 [Lycorma delicatula]|uniref:PI-PLC X domain-containing protein 1 n=1 Tax=Lycorma delicatula TaxID=130591 RepID=UPI003F51824E